MWAPNAQGVRVVGDFNYWDGTAHPMRVLGLLRGVGVVHPGHRRRHHVQVRVLGRDGIWREKADPFAFATELPPATGSVVFTSHYAWDDDDWMAQRAQRDVPHTPMSTYEVHLGSWRRGLDYRALAAELTDYVLRAWASPTSSSCPSPSTPSALLGLPGHLLLRTDLAVRLPR